MYATCIYMYIRPYIAHSVKSAVCMSSSIWILAEPELINWCDGKMNRTVGTIQNGDSSKTHILVGTANVRQMAKTVQRWVLLGVLSQNIQACFEASSSLISLRYRTHLICMLSGIYVQPYMVLREFVLKLSCSSERYFCEICCEL